MALIAIFAVSFALSLVLHPVAIWISKNLKIFDNPYRDGIHVRPTPVLGGAAICVSIFVAVIMARTLGLFEWSRVADGLLVGGGLIALVGFIDDRFGMNPAIKLAGQFMAAGMFVAFTEAGLDLLHPLIEFVGLIFLLVVMMNAFNILDNMDAVVGSMSFAAGMAFLAVAMLSGDHNLAIILAAVIGGVVGFLRYNLPRAKIFMGDSGAMFLGFVFGAVAIVYMMNNRSYYLLTTPMLILSYPVFDISLVSLSRMREKRSISVAAPDSSPYRLVRWVFSTRNAFIAVFLMNLVMGLFGVATYILKENQLSVLLIFICGLSLSVLGVHLYRNIMYFLERTFFFLIDMVSINLAFYLLYSLKYSWGVFGPYEVYIPYSQMLAPAIWVSLFWVLLYSLMGIYEIRPDRHFSAYLSSLAKVVGVGMGIFMVAVVFLEGNVVISILPVICYAVALFALNLVLKYAAFLYIRWRSEKSSQRPMVAIVIKGTPDRVDKLLDLARGRFQVVGYIAEADRNSSLYGLEYLGDFGKISEIIRARRLAKIILSWPDDDYENFMPLLASYYYLENDFLVMGEPGDVFKGFKKSRLYRTGFTRVSGELLRTWEWAVKRCFDIIVSALTLLVTGPIFLYEYIAAKMGKCTFLVEQEFYGRDGRADPYYSFGRRAMAHAERGVVRFGLPALLSVVAGHLSLVGNLPLSPEAAVRESKRRKGFWRRELIKPGIFGLPHLHEQETFLDLELSYMEKMSILLDVWLLLTGILHSLWRAATKRRHVRYQVY